MCSDVTNPHCCYSITYLWLSVNVLMLCIGNYGYLYLNWIIDMKSSVFDRNRTNHGLLSVNFDFVISLKIIIET